MNEIIPTPNTTLTLERFIELFNEKVSSIPKIFVYAWKRDDKYLYVGLTTIGMRRFDEHDIVKYELTEETDAFEFWYCNTINDVAHLEKKLIYLLNPTCNTIRYSFVSDEDIKARNKVLQEIEQQNKKNLRDWIKSFPLSQRPKICQPATKKQSSSRD